MKLKNKILTKGNRILACHLLALSLLASCSQDDALPRSVGTNLPSLGLSTLQATDIPADETVTRAAGTTAYPTNKFIGFFVKADATNGYTACNNRKGEYNTTRKLWLPTPDSIWLNNHDADIAVYAPYDAAHTTAACDPPTVAKTFGVNVSPPIIKAQVLPRCWSTSIAVSPSA